LEAGDLRCAICGQATPAERTPRTQALEVKILRCTGCGAALAYDPEHQAPSCSFCGEVVRVESVDDPMEQTEHYLPFTVTAEEARRALRTWLGSRGWFRPSDLSARAQLTELKPLWWVAWVFDAEAFLSWAADSNAGARRSAWAPHAGQNQVHFDDLLVSASRGLTHQETSAITPGMDLSTKRPTPEGAGPQAMLEQFDLQRSQARQYLLGAIERISHQRVQSQFIPGTRFRNVKVSVVLRSLITRRLSLPAYVLAYRYKGDLYRVVICGQDRRLVVGDSPRSLIKMIGVGLATALLVLIVLAAVAGG
jgi:rubredoxin